MLKKNIEKNTVCSIGYRSKKSLIKSVHNPKNGYEWQIYGVFIF